MKKEYLIALEYEAKRLRKINQLEDLGLNVFDDPWWGNYEILYMVLDELKIPEDSSKKPRDKYNNAYMDFYTSEKKIEPRTITKLIEKLKKLCNK